MKKGYIVWQSKYLKIKVVTNSFLRPLYVDMYDSGFKRISRQARKVVTKETLKQDYEVIDTMDREDLVLELL